MNTPVNAPARETGTVKWFSFSKGYGYITTEHGVDAFVHRTDSAEPLRAKQAVTFELELTARGARARHVQRVKSALDTWLAAGTPEMAPAPRAGDA